MSAKDRATVELVDLPCFGRLVRLAWRKRRWATWSDDGRYVTLTSMDAEAALAHLREAQQALENSRRAEYTALLVRDEAMVAAHRAGTNSSLIGEITGMNQPNVVRGRRRAVTRREVLPDGLLGPAEALRRSGLSVQEFVRLVESGELSAVEVHPGVHAFRPEVIAGRAKAV